MGAFYKNALMEKCVLRVSFAVSSFTYVPLKRKQSLNRTPEKKCLYSYLEALYVFHMFTIVSKHLCPSI